MSLTTEHFENIKELLKDFKSMKERLNEMDKHIQLSGDGKIIHTLRADLSGISNYSHLIEIRIKKIFNLK